LGKQKQINNDGIAFNVIEPLFGNCHQLIISIGLRNGSLKDIVFANSQASAN
jgi:hypothetical protein